MTPSAAIDAQPARLLIVDDDLANREVLDIVLSHDGFAISMAASGEEALAIVAQRPLDLILLDAIMQGMSGYEVMAVIKGNLATKHIPIIMITGLSDYATKTRALRAGAADFLTKPVDRAMLCRRIREILAAVSPDAITAS